MRLRINGEEMVDIEAETLRALLDHLKIEPGRVAVEVNLRVIKKGEYDAFRLQDGDSVEIVNFVGGG